MSNIVNEYNIIYIDLLNYMWLVHAIHLSVGHETVARVHDAVSKRLYGKSLKNDMFSRYCDVFQKCPLYHLSKKMCRGKITY